jgi:hypothetical protein
MSGPSKVMNVGSSIQRRAPVLTDLFVFFNAVTGLGGQNTLSALKDLIAAETDPPMRSYDDITEMLANEVITEDYFAFVVDASDDENVPIGVWALYIYQGGGRASLDSYLLVQHGEVALEYAVVVGVGADVTFPCLRAKRRKFTTAFAGSKNILVEDIDNLEEFEIDFTAVGGNQLTFEALVNMPFGQAGWEIDGAKKWTCPETRSYLLEAKKINSVLRTTITAY